MSAYAATEAPLFTEQPAEVVHVLMPNMAWACGGNIITKPGRFRVGASEWDRITCVDCREYGQAALLTEQRRMQGAQEAVA